MKRIVLFVATNFAILFVLNLVLALPVYALVRRIVGEGQRMEGAPEVEVLV